MLVFVSVCISLTPFYFCNHFDEKERAGCFAFIVFLMSCYCQWYVALPRGAIGLSTVCDRGISWSYSFFLILTCIYMCMHVHGHILSLNHCLSCSLD